MSVLGFNRSKMECHEFYCHYRTPQKFLQSIEFLEDFEKCVLMLIVNFFIYTLLAFCLVSYRLKFK